MNYSCRNKKPCYDDGKCYSGTDCPNQYQTFGDQIKNMNDNQLANFLHHVSPETSVADWYQLILSEKRYEGTN